MLEELGSLAQAKLNQVLNAGNAQMFFEEIHEVRGTVAADARQLINREFFLIMFIDVVDDGADFLFLAVALGRQLLGNDIVVLKEQVEEMVELGFELKFIVFLLTITCFHSG